MSKREQLENLYAKYRDEFEGKEIVTGDGNVDAGILLIGEAPGKDEVRLSKPFVGMAGKNLSEFLNILGVERELIYITNAIKHRLSKINPDTGRVINRPAAKEEIKQGREYLLEEINIIKPVFIVTLGNVPLRAVTGDNNIVIGSVHGQLATITVGDSAYKLFPLYHPASIIYNQGLKETYVDDIKKLKEIMKK